MDLACLSFRSFYHPVDFFSAAPFLFVLCPFAPCLSDLAYLFDPSSARPFYPDPFCLFDPACFSVFCSCPCSAGPVSFVPPAFSSPFHNCSVLAHCLARISSLA